MRKYLLSAIIIMLFGLTLPAFSADEAEIPAENQTEAQNQNSPEKSPASNNELPEINVELREGAGVEIQAGVVVPVLNMHEISTESCPIGFKTKFISTNDLFIGDIKVIPENTAFYGYIEKINEPIVGTNAAMKIKITKFILPDGYEQNVKAYLYSSNDNLIGGELTEPAEWVKVPHYQDTYQGIAWIHRGATLQMRPGGKRAMGRHTRIPSGERLLIIFMAPFSLNHTYSD